MAINYFREKASLEKIGRDMYTSLKTIHTQPVFTCSKSTVETAEQCVKSVKS